MSKLYAILMTALAALFASPVYAVDLTGLVLDTTGIVDQAVVIGTSILSVVGAIWAIRKVISVVRA